MKRLILALMISFASLELFSQTYHESVRLGSDDATGLLISRFNSGLTDIPGSQSGMLFNAPLHAHLVFDIQGNDANDGLYVRVPSVRKLNPVVDKTAFAVRSDGKVGIGTSLPKFDLDITGSNTETTTAGISSGGNAVFRQSRGSTSYEGGYFFYTGSTLDWRFYEAPNGNNLNIRDESIDKDVLTIQDNTGYIGIGTSPSFPLDVNGATRLVNSNNSGMVVSGFTSAIPGVPGSTTGIKIQGPANAHLVVDIQGNDPMDGFYVRVPTTLEPNPVVDKMAFVIKANGNVGIGVDPGDKLTVDGKIRSEEVKVEIINAPDYVFGDDYQLRPLKNVKEYIIQNKHLPDIPSGKEMEANGVDLGKMNMMLLRKIEELTLHLISVEERLQDQENTINTLRSELGKKQRNKPTKK